MPRIKPCPFCGPKVMVAREEAEEALSGPKRSEFMNSICDRCWGAITAAMDEKPVNEAEQLDGAR